MQQITNTLAAAALCVMALAFTTSGEAQPTPQNFTFGLIGDMAYAPAREPLFENVLAEMNAAPLAFSVHVGDLSSPRYGCDDAFRARRLAQFRAMAHPLIYTPGDNDWTDCNPKQNIANGDPLERLADLRQNFFNGNTTLGKRTFPVTRQSDAGNPAFAKYRENVRWEMGGVMFFTLHAVGSNNGLGRDAAGDAEVAERTAANIAWMQQGFALAKTNNSYAIMILQQANMFPEFLPFPGDPAANPSGFTEQRNALRKELFAYDKPVVLVNGDSHFFRIDKPFARRVARDVSEPLIDKFTRVETFGDPVHHWVHVTVDVTDPNVFTFRERIVAANIEKKN
jgi:hypothetical protein